MQVYLSNSTITYRSKFFPFTRRGIFQWNCMAWQIIVTRFFLLSDTLEQRTFHPSVMLAVILPLRVASQWRKRERWLEVEKKERKESVIDEQIDRSADPNIKYKKCSRVYERWRKKVHGNRTLTFYFVSSNTNEWRTIFNHSNWLCFDFCFGLVPKHKILNILPNRKEFLIPHCIFNQCGFGTSTFQFCSHVNK